ncbi:MAG: RNA-binding protein [Gammaproteobacteria bacterium]|nr:RNA-binding protein [Gammaproteobacteria bacterium]
MSQPQEDKIRIDKWLWAARFYKTRAIAHTAVTGGKVHLAGQRIKPSRMVKLGDIYQVKRGFDLFTIEVKQLSGKRGSASIAQLLYEETEESIKLREKEVENRKLAALSKPMHSKKPNKKQRRQIISFTGK